MILRFTKMHGAGNDFIVIDTLGPARHFDPDVLGKSGRRQLADRHTGIGCDQLLVLNAPRHDDADVWVRIFNSDGSEAAQCGNGMRCIARFLADKVPGQTQWKLDSEAGLMKAQTEQDGSVSVDMGPPDTGPEATGCKTEVPVNLNNESVVFSLVSMGNPHAVIQVDDIATAPVSELGPALQQYFDHGVNVGFAQILDPNRLALRVWERGAGETRACG
ncbi:MAG: diaminopimelate epimerase, partial [Gammaproteobacteria bacterium]|nr:diaminopimelate epimerase [Gammaproteobacteria bacterium]